MGSYDDREQAVFERSVALLSDVDPQLQVGDGGWSARDVLAHLVTVIRRYTTVPRLADTPRGVDLINAEELADLDGATVAELLDAYAEGFAGYRALWVEMGPEHQWPFHGGGHLPTQAVRTNWLGEMTVHGYDVAVAAQLPWSVDDVDAADLLAFLRLIVPAYARPGEAVSVAIAPDGGPAWTIRIAPDVATTVDGSDRVEAVVRGPAWSLALMLYQRLAAADAASRGVSIVGDAGAVERLFAMVERP